MVLILNRNVKQSNDYQWKEIDTTVMQSVCNNNCVDIEKSVFPSLFVHIILYILISKIIHIDFYFFFFGLSFVRLLNPSHLTNYCMHEFYFGRIVVIYLCKCIHTKLERKHKISGRGCFVFVLFLPAWKEFSWLIAFYKYEKKKKRGKRNAKTSHNSN